MEVDLIYDHPSRPLAFEVGSRKHARTGLRRLLERHPELRGRSWVVLQDTPWRSADDDPEGIGTINLPSFLWTVSRQIARAMVDRFR